MSRIVSRRVISLPGSARRAQFFAQPGVAGFEVWDAFDGRTGAGVDRFDVEAFARAYGVEPQGGEIGCAISHADLIRDFAGQQGAGDDLMLVAEDDAVLAPRFDEVLDRVTRQRGFGVAVLAQPAEDFRLDPWWSKARDMSHLSLLARPVGPWPRPSAYRLGEAGGHIMGAGLYLVTRDAARALTAYCYRVGLSWVADDYDRWHRAAGVRVHLLRPNLAGWIGDSEINAETRPHHELAPYKGHPMGRQAWVRRWSRARAGASVAWHQDVLRRAK